MERDIYNEKFNRWLNFAKAHEIKKSESCPFLLGLVKSLGCQVTPVHFWPYYLKFSYFVLAFLVPWLALVQFFSGNFLFNSEKILWNNIIISVIACSILGLLLSLWIHRKAKKLKLPNWEQF